MSEIEHRVHDALAIQLTHVTNVWWRVRRSLPCTTLGQVFTVLWRMQERGIVEYCGPKRGWRLRATCGA